MGSVAHGLGLRIILIDGDSYIARALLPLLAGNDICSIVLKDGGPGRHIVEDLFTIPHALNLQDAVIVNCAGVESGSGDLLHRMNVELPRIWARAARKAGARNFIHVSSFSVYGIAEGIDRATPIRPVSPYGQSRVEGERAIISEAADGLKISLLRVPALIGDGVDKLAQLVRMIRNVRLILLPAQRVSRSMLSYSGLALSIARLIQAPQQGVVLAADPKPFCYSMIPDAFENAGMKVFRMPVPVPMEAVVKWLVPSIHRRMLLSMTLSPDANLLNIEDEMEGVEQVIDRLIAQHGEA